MIVWQNLELNLNHDWTSSYEGGKETPLIFGPGLTGLANLGNRYRTCPSPEVGGWVSQVAFFFFKVLLLNYVCDVFNRLI